MLTDILQRSAEGASGEWAKFSRVTLAWERVVFENPGAEWQMGTEFQPGGCGKPPGKKFSQRYPQFYPQVVFGRPSKTGVQRLSEF